MLKKLNLRNGKVICNDMEDIDFNASLEKQINKLDQDLLHIKYGEKYIIDAGWYPDSDINGSFIIHVIENHDWNNPLLIKKALMNTFIPTLQECIDFVAALQKASVD